LFKLLKGGHCYSPNDMGYKDILISGGKIIKIEDDIKCDMLWDIELIHCNDRIILPGIIDQHIHILGGGGEGGPASRVPELDLSELLLAAETTVVGVLGVDSITRNIAGLLTKAKALEIEGMNTYIYTGSYSIPTATLTGKVSTDIAFIDKVIGVGEIAISDFRSSHPTVQTLKELASETKVGSLIGGKAGVLHIHVGDGIDGIAPLFKLSEDSDIPLDMIIPTHVNRNKSLFNRSLEYLDKGGYIDLTAGENNGKGVSVPDALEMIIGRQKCIDRVSVSSDGNGSIPNGNGSYSVGKVSWLFEDIKSCIRDKHLKIEDVFRTVTSNVAKILKLYPAKGTIQCGSDADIIVLNKNNLELTELIINGVVFVREGKAIVKGRFEN